MGEKQRQRTAKERLVTEGYLDIRLDDLKKEIREEVRGETVKILHAIDAVMTKFDRTEKEEAAHTGLHHGITDSIHKHDRRIGRLESAIKI